MRLKKFFLTNAFGILCSRIFGFLRDALQAGVLGVNIYSDIFFIAFKFPNMFRRVVSEGAFVQSFLPFFLSARSKGAFSISIFFIFIFCLLILSALVMWQTHFVTQILALGYEKDRIALAIPLVRIHFFYLLLIFIVTYLSTLLQYKNIFWVNAYNTVLLNIAMIVAMLLSYTYNLDSVKCVYLLSYSVLVGGVLQIVVHFYPMYGAKIWLLQYIGVVCLKRWFLASYVCLGGKNVESKGFYQASNHSISLKTKYKILYLLHDIRAFFRAFLPSMLGASSAQIIAIIDSSLVTLLPHSEGGVSVLNFANRIFQLPLALFAIAISTALFPSVAKAIKNKDSLCALNSLKVAFWFLLITLSLCTLGGVMLRNEVVCLLFERGNFTRSDTIQVAFAFFGYMLGLLPFGLSRIFSLWLYSHKLQAKAAKISLLSLFIGIVISGSFIIYMRYFYDIDSSGKYGGILWEWRYFIIALSGSLGGLLLFILSIKAFGMKHFFAIISHKKYAFLLIILLILEFFVIKIMKNAFSII